MILATATHELPRFDDAAATRDASLFLDMDLSILGAAPDAFDAYERAVRREYGWVEEPMWRAGCAAVLTGFLARPRIFHTDEFRQPFRASGQAQHGALAGGAAKALVIFPLTSPGTLACGPKRSLAGR